MKRIWILLLMFATILCGCHQRGSVAGMGLFEPFRIADANIPLADNLHTHQFDKVEELEADKYGRRYFSYSTWSVSIQSNVEIHIICQMTQDNMAFYYPDYCYQIRRSEEPPFSEEDIAQLKAWNDWDCPLSEERMYSVSVSAYHEDIAYEDDVRSAVLDYLMLDNSYGVNCNGLESKGGEEQMFVAHVFPRDSTGKATDAGTIYLVVYSSEQPEHILMCQEVNEPLSCQEQSSLFREAWLNSKIGT